MNGVHFFSSKVTNYMGKCHPLITWKCEWQTATLPLYVSGSALLQATKGAITVQTPQFHIRVALSPGVLLVHCLKVKQTLHSDFSQSACFHLQD